MKGVIKNIWELIILELQFFLLKKSIVIKNVNKKISFLPKTSISEIGYNKKIGAYKANNCKIFNLKFLK